MSTPIIFGPVPSRRCGISLGVNLVPMKTCSFNCIYCECGRTTRLTVKREEFFPLDGVISQIDAYLSRKPKLDFVTFSGSGEPTLYSRIGDVAHYIKEHYDYQLALLTNSSLLTEGLIEELSPVDVIFPSLDSATETGFRRINRPHRSLKIDDIIDNLINLRKNYSGTIRLEIFFVKGINNSREEIQALKNAIHRIQPDIVQLNTLDRPGTEQWVEPLSHEMLDSIGKKLEWNYEVISKVSAGKYRLDRDSIRESVYATTLNRPCTIEDLQSIAGCTREELEIIIKEMIKEGLLVVEQGPRGIFFKALHR